MFKLLFACTGNAGRSLMAKAFAERLAPDGMSITAVADTRESTHPLALKAMEEIGMSIPSVAPSMEEHQMEVYDIVVTLCLQLEESCPTFPGSPIRIDWGLMNPGIYIKKEKDLLDHFRRVRDEIKIRVHGLFEHGYLNGYRELEYTYSEILNTMTDGVIAHDDDRRIYFMNHAAEEITGRSF